METKSRGTLSFNNRCRCCLGKENGVLKNMWEEYDYDGEKEVYGDMVSQCFSISLKTPAKELICEQCINRLRDAFTFMKEILASEELMLECQDTKLDINVMDNEIEFKEEKLDSDFEELNQEEHGKADDDDDDDDTRYKLGREEFDGESTDEWTPDQENQLDSDDEMGSQDEDSGSQDAEYLEIEYLEDEVNPKDIDEAPIKRKWPKKKKLTEERKQYRKYHKEAMQKAVEAVMNEEMSKVEAASYYNVSIKTLRRRVHIEEAKKNGEIAEDVPKVTKFQKLNEEIKTILTYTNGTPYKTKSGRMYCAYCSTEGPLFEDADELRLHTRTKHVSERLRGVEDFMKPAWLNEVLKLDIDNLICTICCVPLATWNEMFKHLKCNHDIELDEAYSRVIPYRLSYALNCALCGENFNFYHLLDGHMNSHYNNYICEDCGDTFLSETRHRKHIETHKSGSYPCRDCGKVFTLEKYRKKHYNNMHNPKCKIKCNYCKKMFRTEYLRHLHIREKHKERIKVISCEFCGKVFEWRPYYLKHMRLTHNSAEKKYKCKLCEKSFRMRYELRNHEAWHQGAEGYKCDVCNKKFNTKGYLKRHYSKHSSLVQLDNGTNLLIV